MPAMIAPVFESQGHMGYPPTEWIGAVAHDPALLVLYQFDQEQKAWEILN
jgi:hypothetical protein